MREILFRGKDSKTKNWLCGYYFKAVKHWTDKGIHEDWIACTAIQNGGMCNVCRKFPVMKETVGQFTGLTDKNGKKIFEGDIVKCDGEGVFDGILGCVVYNDGYFLVDYIKPVCDGFNGIAIGLLIDENNICCVEVIGNIHDNPELLEGFRDGD